VSYLSCSSNVRQGYTLQYAHSGVKCNALIYIDKKQTLESHSLFKYI